MSDHSKIEWTDATWNPVRGCEKVSPGCKHCYAETFAERFRGVRGHPYELGFDSRLVPEKLLEPFAWTGPRMVFVNSMSDLFLDAVPDAFIELVTRIMLVANWHTYQILTKRADRMAAMLGGVLLNAARADHIWWGVSVEDRRYGVPRIQALRDTPARTKFLSIEPLLEKVSPLDLSHLSWVIVGGESGPHARALQEDWVRAILADCRRDDVPFFFKQWGGTRKAAAGRALDGRTYDELPPAVRAPMPSSAKRLAFRARFEPELEAWKGKLSPLRLNSAAHRSRRAV